MQRLSTPTSFHSMPFAKCNVSRHIDLSSVSHPRCVPVPDQSLFRVSTDHGPLFPAAAIDGSLHHGCRAFWALGLLRLAKRTFEAPPPPTAPAAGVGSAGPPAPSPPRPVAAAAESPGPGPLGPVAAPRPRLRLGWRCLAVLNDLVTGVARRLMGRVVEVLAADLVQVGVGCGVQVGGGGLCVACPACVGGCMRRLVEVLAADLAGGAGHGLRGESLGHSPMPCAGCVKACWGLFHPRWSAAPRVHHA